MTTDTFNVEANGEYRPDRWLESYPDYVRTADHLKPFALYEMIDRAADDFPDRPFASIDDFILDYGTARSLTHRSAKGLRDIGVGLGDRVGYCMPNSLVYGIASFGAWRLGAAISGLNPLYSPDKLVDQVRDSVLNAIFMSTDSGLKAAVEALSALPERPHLIACCSDNPDPAHEFEMPDWFGKEDIRLCDFLAGSDEKVHVSFNLDDTIAALQYTGGTTGEPKAAMLTHSGLSINVQQMHAWYDHLARGVEVLLAVAPFTHISGIGPIQNFTTFMAGEMAIVPRFVPANALDTIENRRVSILLAPPTMFVGLMNAAEDHKIDWSSVKLVQSGAGPLTDSIRQNFERLCGVPVQNLYGMTEFGPACIYNLPDAEARGHSMAVGLPLPLTEVRIQDKTDPARSVAIGEVGEICIRGPQRMKGYWNRPEETAAAFVDGFFRTGDLGYMTKDGFVYVVDRLKDMIICSGYNVYPVQLENVVMQHPSIREAAVIGIPDDYRGESVKLFVSLKLGSQLTLEQFREDMAGKISKIEMPRELEIMKELPKTPNAKISRLALRDKNIEDRRAAVRDEQDSSQ